MRRRGTRFALAAATASAGCLALGGLVGPGGLGPGAGAVAEAHGGAAHRAKAEKPTGVVEPKLARYLTPAKARKRARWLARAGVRTTKEISFSWQSGTPHPIERFESNGLAAFGKLWVLGGFGKYTAQASPRSDAYDPATDSWKRLPDAPKNVTHAPAVLVGDTIWLIGGFEGKHPGPSIKYVLKYDIGDNSWSRGPDLPSQRGAGGAAAVGSKIYFFGGSTRAAGTTDYHDQKTTWVLDTNNQSAGWVQKADFPAPRNHMSGAAVNGKVYAFGGQLGGNESQGNQKRVDRYDPATNTWTRMADMPTAKGHITSSTFAVAGKVIIGGGTENGNIPSKEVDVYDPSTNTWTKTTPLPSGRKNPVMGAINGKLVSATGYNGTGTRTVWVSTRIPDLDGGTEPPPPPPDEEPPPPPPPPPPDQEPPPPETGAFLPQNGVVTIEAEHYAQTVGRSSKAWQVTTPSGAVGSAVSVLPDTGALYEPPGALTQAPELRYRVYFSQPGTYRLALRVLPQNDDNNSLHVGIDGTIPSSSDKIQTTTYGNWIWMDESRDGPTPATINVTSAGTHTIHVFAREDGTVLDRLVIAPAGSAKPSGGGPAESPRSGETSPPPPPPPPPDTPPTPEAGAFLPQNGVVTIDAEHYAQTVGRSSKAWQTGTPAGAVGSAVTVLPDTDALYEPPGALTQAPELRYRVYFGQPGTYRLALRVLPQNDDNNSLHVGIDGTIPSSSDKIQTTTYGNWIWMDESRDGPTPATINVTSAGTHTIHVFAREDGTVLDRLVIAPAGSAKPSGSGPAESPRA